jgi:hypothetical protein
VSLGGAAGNLVEFGEHGAALRAMARALELTDPRHPAHYRES